MKINCILVDDEPLAMDVLEEHLNTVPDVTLLRRCHSAAEAAFCLREEQVDLIFLDIRMPGMSGLQFLSSLSQPPMVIFTTAHRQFAFDGYDHNIIDFLLKPIPLKRFLQAIDKVRLRMTAKQPMITEVENTANDEIFIRTGTKMVKIRISTIVYVEGMKDYLKLHISTGKIVVIKKTMMSLEQRLFCYEFIRIHKSYIVNSNHIDAIMRDRIRISDVEIPIGRNYRQHVKNYLLQKSLK